MALQFRIIPVTPFQQNCSLVWCDQTMEAAFVDPGGDVEQLQAALTASGAKLTRILLTHGHLDHVGGTVVLARQYDVPIEGPHREEAFWLTALPQQAMMFGFPPAQPFSPTRWLEEGDRVTVGSETLEVLHCPGHTPGHVVFFHRASELAFVGDVLFAGSIGRTDFPRGDHAALVASIRHKLFPLGDAVRFVPGHGPMSTFGEERATNPFVAGRAG